MKNVLSIVDGELRLNSCMTEMAFGKTNYENIISQAGILAECDSYDQGKYHFSFSTWNFNEVKSYDIEDYESEDRFVFYCGKNPLSDTAQTLDDFFEAAGKENASKEIKDRMFEASFAVCSILTQAAKEKTVFPLVGAGGILVQLEEARTKVLFLPQNLYAYSVAGLPPIQSASLQGCWINTTLTDLPAICFNRAVLVYKMLTGRFPYTSSNQIERNADILDRKFLPLEMSINGINLELAKNVNKGLKLNSNAVYIPGKNKKGKDSEDLTPTPDFPLDLLYNFKNETLVSSISDEEFAEKSAAYLKKQNSIVKTKRNIRRNTTTIIIAAIAIIILGIIINSSRKNKLDNYTSIGLTSTETLKGFFYGVNQKDLVLIDRFASGKKVQPYIDSVSQLYVISKQRQVYYHDKGFTTMEEWLFWATDERKDLQSGLYGITDLKIDGKSTELTGTLPKLKDKPAVLTEEKGIKLENGSISVHTVDYYLVHSEGEDNQIFVEQIHETVTLTFKKDHWAVTDISTESTPLKIQSRDFKHEYFNRVQENNYDVVKTVKEMRNSYFWLPTNEAMKNELNIQIQKAKDPYGFGTN